MITDHRNPDSLLSVLRDDHIGEFIVDGSIPQRKVRTPIARTADEWRRLTLQAKEGDEASFYADVTNGVVWRFVYLPDGSLYPWKIISGAPLFSEVTTQQGTASTTYVALATAGPSLNPPIDGDYLVMIGALIIPAAGFAALMSYDIGATGAVDADFIDGLNGTAVSIAFNGCRARRKTITANSSLVAKYRVTGGTGNFQDRWMSLLPVRVA